MNTKNNNELSHGTIHKKRIVIKGPVNITWKENLHFDNKSKTLRKKYLNCNNCLCKGFYCSFFAIFVSEWMINSIQDI